MHAKRLLWLLPCLLLVWLVCMGSLCPGGGSTLPCPLPNINTTTLPNGLLGEFYSQPLNVDGGDGLPLSVVSGALPPGLAVGASSIAGTPSGAGIFTFTLQVEDECGSATRDLSITVDGTCPALGLGATTLPGGAIGERYSGSFLATGGFNGIDIVVTSGSLPPGLSIDEFNGRLHGTPTTAGTSTFTVEARDECVPPQVVTREYTITITTCPAFSLRATTLPVGAVGTFYLGDFLAIGGAGFETITVTSGALPAGLEINGAQNIVGTPTTAGTSTFTVVAEDDCVPPQVVTREYTITINEAGDCPPLTLDATPFPDGEPDVPYLASVVFTGGIALIDVVVASGSLPPGIELTLDNDLAGTPTTAGTFNFTLRVTDSCTPVQTTEEAYTIVIEDAAACADPPILGLTGLFPGVVGEPYPALTIPVTFGEPPFSFTVSSGQLPAGLSLVNSTGEIVGTPTGPAGMFPFEVTVTDSCVPPQSDTKASSITITGGAAAVNH